MPGFVVESVSLAARASALHSKASASALWAGNFSLLAQRKVTKRKCLPRQGEPGVSLLRGIFRQGIHALAKNGAPPVRRPPGLGTAQMFAVTQKQKALAFRFWAPVNQGIASRPGGRRARMPAVFRLARDGESENPPQIRSWQVCRVGEGPFLWFVSFGPAKEMNSLVKRAKALALVDNDQSTGLPLARE